MLNEKEIKALERVLEGRMTKQQIADEGGWKDARSIYYLMEREEAKEYMTRIAERSVSEAVGLLKSNANEAARSLIKIAKGEINDKDKQTIYASLQAINSLLEKSGLSSKNITLTDNREQSAKVSDDDLLADLEGMVDIEEAE